MSQHPVEVRIYGGLGEIGGNKVMVSSPSKQAIILDFGKSFSREEAFFQHPFMSPAFPEDYFKTGLLPPSEGPWWKMEGYETLGVFLSHAHLDHWGYLHLLHSDIRVFLGEAAWQIVDVYRFTRRDLGGIDRLEIGTFKTGDILSMGDFSVTPIHVDHSVPGAYGFLIECCGRKLAYTGDLRMHGPKAHMTKDFVDACASEGIDLMIMEATKVAPENDPESSLVKVLENRVWYRWRREPPKRISFEVSTEDEVGERMIEVLERSDALVLVEVSSADVDRIRTVFEVARKLNRELVMDERTALISERLSESGVEGLPLPGDYKLWRKRRRGRNGEEVKIGLREPKAVKEFLERIEDRGGPESIIWGSRRADMLKEGELHLVITSNATRFLYEIPMGVKPKIDFIMSRSEPFSEESALSLDRLMNWLLMYDVARYYRIHVSGHLFPDQIRDVLDSVNPAKVVPIHTEHSDLFDLYVPRRMLNSILLPQLGEPFEI